MVLIVTKIQQYNVGEKPTVIFYTFNCLKVHKNRGKSRRWTWMCNPIILYLLGLGSGSNIIGESRSIIECTTTIIVR